MGGEWEGGAIAPPVDFWKDSRIMFHSTKKFGFSMIHSINIIPKTSNTLHFASQTITY